MYQVNSVQETFTRINKPHTHIVHVLT